MEATDPFNAERWFADQRSQIMKRFGWDDGHADRVIVQDLLLDRYGLQLTTNQANDVLIWYDGSHACGSQ